MIALDAAKPIELSMVVLYYIDVLAWPFLVLVLAIMFKSQFVHLLNRISSAALPGGVKLDFEKAVHEAKVLSREVEAQAAAKRSVHVERRTAEFNESNKKMTQLGLDPSPSGLDMEYYRELARTADPAIALAGLRIELEVLARNVAKGFGVQIDGKAGVGSILRALYKAFAITEEQHQLAVSIVSLCNRAVHGERVTLAQADSVIDSAAVLARMYSDWLGWGFNNENGVNAQSSTSG